MSLEHHRPQPSPTAVFEAPPTVAEPPATAVFVDHSGRRRRLIMFASIAGSVVVLGVLIVMVGGLFTGTTLSVSGWPGDQPGGPAGTASPPRASPTPTPRRTIQASEPPVTTPARTASSSPSAEAHRTRSAEPTRVRDQQEPPRVSGTDPGERPAAERPTVDPGSSTSAEPVGEPADEDSAGPTAEPVPTELDLPGRDFPPGHDPDKTRGPKR
ncbi:hypothetical protein ABGB18_02110 [Nonomuraea sp. B12E4]|uniref:hypothetical protein n=1 Tax=Nonomuraea sp. B12E4 TaxID=3153564 RepID=UPI00325D25F2